MASDTTVDSPLFSDLGTLTCILSNELKAIEDARIQEQEIEVRRIPIEGKRNWVRIEPTHPTKDVAEILVQLNSLAPEGISCALIISLANLLRSLSKLFVVKKSSLHVCDLGPIIGGERWVDLVIASSNYIRHKDEWSEDFAKGKSPNAKQQNSVGPLSKSGLSNVWESKISFLQLAKHLQVDTWETLNQNLSAWLNACLPFHPGRN